MKLREALRHPTRLSGEWVFLPRDRSTWTLESDVYALDLKEIPPDVDDDEADLPDEAIAKGLRTVLTVEDFEDVVSNALQQKPNAGDEELFLALQYYLDHDAYLEFR
jgi:hypothetical protein